MIPPPEVDRAASNPPRCTTIHRGLPQPGAILLDRIPIPKEDNSYSVTTQETRHKVIHAINAKDHLPERIRQPSQTYQRGLSTLRKRRPDQTLGTGGPRGRPKG